MINRLFLFFVLLSPIVSFAQIISLEPTGADPDQLVTLTFDASQGNAELAGADKIYIHHGVVLSGPEGTDWNLVQGNWGQDDGVGEMTNVGGDLWQFTFAPTLREHFGADSNDDLFRISCVFRSADGVTKGTLAEGEYGWGTVLSNLDVYINLNVDNFVGFTSPQGSESFINEGGSISINAVASSDVSEMTLSILQDGQYNDVATVNSGKTISYQYAVTETKLLEYKVSAIVDGSTLEDTAEHNVILIQSPVIESLPAGSIAGINYNDSNPSKVTLVLEAPGKSYAHVVGDFSNWSVLAENQMKQTPDGEFFWIDINNLVEGQPYVFQYWVEDNVKIGDPYATQVADPWNDKFIPETIFPDLPFYDKTSYGFASVLQTGQEEYDWADTEDDWQSPNVDNIVIYELLIRDFLASHSYDDLIDTLDYLERLGVDAIELMPINEFEGNESWGYNPAYYFAPDKYYGTSDDLKAFIEAAHQRGLAIIVDAVLNHAFGQNPMVKLYWNSAAGKPAADNPWFNEDHVGQYQWGYDFDHESEYTQRFLDRVNKYWIEEYHIDGYRFDFTKGFTNNAPGGSVDGFDQSRIDLLKRMVDVIWETDNDSYIILEHWAPFSEEQILADYGMKMWRNRSYDYVPAIVGNVSGSFNDMEVTSHVSFFNSHDERRIAEHALTEGGNKEGYDVKNPLIMFERVKMAAAFNYLYPGPKMIWQFDELGYDIDINFNGRTGNKPLPWGNGSLQYYEDPLRQHIYSAYREILWLRDFIGETNLQNATTSHKESGVTRRLSYNTSTIDLVVIGNFGLEENTITGSFSENGTWYDYFSGDSITVTSTNETLNLVPGEWHIYTSSKISDGFPGVIEIFQNPVTISPENFTKDTPITITFDAKKASRDGTLGLVGATQVYMHSGVVKNDPQSTVLSNIVGTFLDDGLGEMTSIGDDKWEISINASDYYGLDSEEDIYKLGMYFRDAENINVGKGFRGSTIYFNVESDKPFITVEPAAFEIDEEITLTFNALKGNGELIGVDKVYMHSGVDLTNTETPYITGWQNVVGNWGNDDGVGLMSMVAGETDQWEISFVPEDYYGLDENDQLRWICAVFRDAAGNTKGTGESGDILHGFIHTNQDFFIRNQLIISTESSPIDINALYLSPNPASDRLQVTLEGFAGTTSLQIMDVNGKIVVSNEWRITQSDSSQHVLDISQLSRGTYFLMVRDANHLHTKSLIKL